jgi:hypothetical protein
VTKRWSQTQHLVAAYLAAHGFPYAEVAGTGATGIDITGCPGLAIEVKAQDGWRPTTWLRQAGGHEVKMLAPGLPVVPLVVQRPKGFGDASLGQWPVIVPLAHEVRLLRAAGYGEEHD